MAAQPFCGAGRLPPQPVQEPPLILRIFAAGHQQILDHQNTQTVAFVVKNILFEQAAAPYPQHGDMGLRRQPQQTAVFFRRGVAGEGFAGHPVGTLAENLRPIDQHRITGIVLVLIQFLEPRLTLQPLRQFIFRSAGTVGFLHHPEGP